MGNNKYQKRIQARIEKLSDTGEDTKLIDLPEALDWEKHLLIIAGVYSQQGTQPGDEDGDNFFTNKTNEEIKSFIIKFLSNTPVKYLEEMAEYNNKNLDDTELGWEFVQDELATLMWEYIGDGFGDDV